MSLDYKVRQPARSARSERDDAPSEAVHAASVPIFAPASLLALQRTAGNQAVQGMIAARGQDRTLARFAQPDATQPEVRISTNDRIVILGKKDLLADEEAIAEANAALAQVVGGRGAFLQLGGEAAPDWPGFLRVQPRWVGPKGEVPELMQTLDTLNKLNLKDDPGPYLTHADCHMTAQTIMGSTDEGSGIHDKEKAIVTGFSEDDLGRESVIEPIPKETTEGKISDHGANRVLDQFLITALPRFAQRLEAALNAHMEGQEEEARNSRIGKLYAATIAEIRGRMGGSTNVEKVQKLRLAYRKILQDKTLRHLFGHMFGINEYADPQIGDALVQFNDEAQKKAEESKTEKIEMAKEEGRSTAGMQPGRDLWNFHWAGVIMRDGPDYVTLENLSVENMNVKNEAWYFAMYGPLQQSFHSEASKDPHVGDYPLTLPMRAMA